MPDDARLTSYRGRGGAVEGGGVCAASEPARQQRQQDNPSCFMRRFSKQTIIPQGVTGRERAVASARPGGGQKHGRVRQQRQPPAGDVGSDGPVGFDLDYPAVVEVQLEAALAL